MGHLDELVQEFTQAALDEGVTLHWQSTVLLQEAVDGGWTATR